MKLNQTFFKLKWGNDESEMEVKDNIKNFLNEEVDVKIHSPTQILITSYSPSEELEDKISELVDIINPSIIATDYCWLSIKDGWYGSKLYWIEIGNWTQIKQKQMEDLKYKSYRL